MHMTQGWWPPFLADTVAPSGSQCMSGWTSPGAVPSHRKAHKGLVLTPVTTLPSSRSEPPLQGENEAQAGRVLYHHSRKEDLAYFPKTDVWLRCDGRRRRHSRNYFNWEKQGKNSRRSTMLRGLLKLCQNTILISTGTITDIPQTARLRPDTYFSQLWGLDIQDQGPADPVFHELLSSSSR